MHLPSYIDGGPFDIVTVIVAIAVALAKCHRHKRWVVSKETGFDVVHGVAIFPLLALSLAVFNKELVSQLNSVTLSVAGVVALLTILESEFKKETEL